MSTITADELQASLDAFITETNTFWLMFGAVLVFFMQTGFGMLEVGSVSTKNTKNILVKNVFDASIGALCWWSFGYAAAMGNGDAFIGKETFFMTTATFRGAPSPDVAYSWAGWLFQWSFAATAATIVTGSVAERITFKAYLIYTIVLVCYVYPVVVHWGWSGVGWASAWREENLLAGCGVTDFAGSGVVHTTGGVVALIGAVVIGPRTGRFDELGNPVPLQQQSFVFQTLGTLILWFGWYGFNAVSTLYIGNYAAPAARAMVTTTIAAASGAVSAVLVAKIKEPDMIDPSAANNGVLAGLVGITASCSVVEPEGAFIIGLVAGAIYIGSSELLLKLKIDDVVNAAPVHMFCGIWGVIAAGLFASEDAYAAAYYSARASKCAGAFYGGDGSALGAQIAFLIVLLLWTGFWGSLMFLIMKRLNILRVSKEIEDAGMDVSKHGGFDGPAFMILKQVANVKVHPIEAKNEAPASANESKEEVSPI
mmetsp:Transcript_33899/g.43551  ORF Transcript_33899/g.43551 Transcript_33899/m.43551 type:complete len:482 (+) Transcript_33899:138-1583(+)